MGKSHIKVKIKKKKINIKRIIVFILILFLLYSLTLEILSSKISNIYIINNNIVPDKDIIEELNLKDYPSFYKSIINNKKNINNPYIKDFKIRKKMWNKLYIEVTEYKPISIYNNQVLLENSKLVDNIYDINYLPHIVNDIDLILGKYVENFSKIDNNILYRISEIKYDPTEVDKERFTLYMIDGNQVYITLSKIEKINKYDKIIQKTEGKNGIIYLDLGDYIEIKD